MQRVCSIIFFDGYVSIAPTITNFSRVLEKCGYLVTIFATQHHHIPQPNRIGVGVKVLYFSKPFKNFFLRLKQVNELVVLVGMLELIIYAFQYIFSILKKSYQGENSKNNTNVLVDANGLFIGAFLWFYFFRQNFIFLSLELEETRKVRIVAKIYKEITKLAYKKSTCVIVQDEDRFKSLSEYYQYQHPKVFYLPNSPLNDWSPDANKLNFFREKFSLSKDKFPYIVLQAGQLNDIVCSKSLASAFASIDNGCALIFHGVQADSNQENPYIQSLQQVNSKNLFLSLEPLPLEEVDKIYASSTIGLAFYAKEHAENENYSKIAKACGKLAQSLKHGKPVLMSNLPSLRQLVEKYQFGILINNPSDSQEIKVAIDKILSSYDTYSNNAKLCFESEFNFEKRMEPIVSFINSLQTGF